MQLTMNPFFRGASLALLVSAGSVAWSPHVSATETLEATGSNPKSTESSVKRITREGVVVEFTATPVSENVKQVMASDWSDISFRITDATTGEPIKGRYPAAWMDLALSWEAKGDKPMSCTDRVQTYLQGIVGIRPMVDLNSHFLLVMNADASISVIDPIVGITGVTNLFAQINLEQPGADWAKTDDQKKLFISMPLANKVAQADTDSFKVLKNIDAGERPTRAELQNDERYLWIGNNATRAELSGVTIIDIVSQKPVAFIATGEGHHEIAFTDDDRLAFVTNRKSGTVTVIDVQKREKIKDLVVGEVPIALAYSTLGRALYVADSKTGDVTVIDGDSLEVRTRIKTKPGLGPMRFDEDGRWGVIVNPIDDSVFIVDATKDTLAHKVTVGKQPYQVTFTRSFAYVRSLGTHDVGLIPTSELDSDKFPPITYVGAGTKPPGAAAKISIADSIIPSVKQAAAYIVNQADGTVSYYMEGMTAPMGAFRNRGHEIRAIEIVDRSLSEKSPGVYTGRVKLPVEGTYDIAFMMDTPRFLHCFDTVVVPNPDIESTAAKMAVEFLTTERMLAINSDYKFRFKLTDPRSGKTIENLNDAQVLYYRTDGRNRSVVAAPEVEKGVYEATIRLGETSAYYVFVGSKSKGIRFSDLPFYSVMGVNAPAPKNTTKMKKDGGDA